MANDTQLQPGPSYSVGLDPSLTGFGVYCLPLNGEHDWYGWRLQSTARDGSDTRRVLEITSDIIGCLADLDFPIQSFSFEDYGPIGKTSGKITARAEMCGILKHYALTALRVPVITVPPNALKQFSTGKGNASKEDMLTEANKHGYYPDTHDEADAYFVARLGRAAITGGNIGVSYERINP